MSGICAVWQKDPQSLATGAVTRVVQGLALRNSEQSAQKSDRNAGVGASKAFSSQQVFESEAVLIACDAQLYNEKELRSYISGALPASSATSALLAQLYARFGAVFVEKLRGAFSIVLWDRQKRQLLAAVDEFGINRLVYYEDTRIFAIASRIDALVQAGDIPTDINPRAVANVLHFANNLAPDTIFAKVHRLTPGTLLIAGQNGSRTEPYWDMRYGRGTDRNEERLSRKLEEVVEQAVASCCQDDAFSAVGSYLSGGTDSSTVVGMMSRLNRGPVKAFSIGFEEERFNELEYAEITARKFQAEHHVYRVSAADCMKALPEMVRYFDEPFGNSSAIPTYFCAKLAAEAGVKALLSGDGGDELFGGNERYLTDRIFQAYRRIPGFVRKGLIEPVVTRIPAEDGFFGKARKYVRRSNIPRVERIFSYHLLSAHAMEEVFEPDFLHALGAYSVLEAPTRYYDEAPAVDPLDRFLYLDVKITLGDSDLPKVTQMSELAGIQTRFPFLDRTVAEFSGEIPANLKVKGAQKRYLFKRAFRKLLPAEVISKKKHGFGLPVSTWLKSDPRMREFARDTLISSQAIERGYIRRSFLEKLFRWHEDDHTCYYGDQLWTFLVLELWHQQFVGEVV